MYTGKFKKQYIRVNANLMNDFSSYFERAKVQICDCVLI